MISFSQYILLEGQLEAHYINKGAKKQDAKDAIARWRKLTPKQKEQVPNPQKYQDLKSFIKDLESAEKFVSKTAKEKQVKESGIQGLAEGEDYLELETGNPDIQAYAPLHWGASKVIASKYVGSCEGKWCVAYQKSSEHWDEYIDTYEGVLIYFIAPEAKYAAYYASEKDYELFNAEDKKLSNSPIDDLVDELGNEFSEIREHFPPNWEVIAQEDDVDSFEERYKQEFAEANTERTRIQNAMLESIVQNRATQCFDWLAKNVGFSDDEEFGLNALYHSMLYGGNPEFFERIYADLGNDISLDYKDPTAQGVLTACILIADRDMSYFRKLVSDKRFVGRTEEIDYLYSRAEIFLGKNSKEREEVKQLLDKRVKELGAIE
jgi:hypothetical protein